MVRKLKFSEIIEGGENPGGVTVQGVNGTDHWPTGGWNDMAFSASPPDWSPDRWKRDAENGSCVTESGAGVLYKGGPPEFGFQKKPR